MIRKATTADRSRITDIRLSVRENRLGRPVEVAEKAKWIYGNSAFWVWEEDGVVQGFSAADPRDGTIFALFVHPDYEGRGIGRALLPRACDELRAAGYSEATLTTDPGTRAERFYRSDGWIEVRRQEDGQIVFKKPLQC
jgi:GNAT superfamily N-acetyltransferase